MALISTIDQVRANGVKLMFFSDETALADFETAEQYFLVPILGEELYELLLTEQDDPDSEYAALLAKVRRAVAPLAYWLDLPNMQTAITDRGIGSMTSQNMEAAHRWEYEEQREALAVKGCFALEKLLQYLYKEKEVYDWTVPDAYKAIFLTGIDFSSVFPVYEPYRTFERLRPLVIQAENQYIRPVIGDDFFEYLRDKIAPTTEEKKAIGLIRITVANLAIKTAAEVLPVKISVNGFTVLLGDTGDRNTDGQKQAGNTQMNMLYASVKETAETTLMQLTDYLNKNASDTVFELYKNSSFYSAPVDPLTVTNPNEDSAVFMF